MNNDRELLEMAAKAAGIELDWFEGCNKQTRAMALTKKGEEWNPLTDDGDALRLAVKLGMEIDSKLRVSTCGQGWFDADEVSDPYAATRRAIVRAAAEIGRKMP